MQGTKEEYDLLVPTEFPEDEFLDPYQTPKDLGVNGGSAS